MTGYTATRESRTANGYVCAWGGLQPLVGTSPIDEPQQPIYFHYSRSAEQALEALEKEMRYRHGCTEFIHRK